jgi:DNA-binding beta-propeller fold protein YncE
VARPKLPVGLAVLALVWATLSGLATAEDQGPGLRRVRALEISDLGRSKPTGLAFSSETDVFFVLGTRPGSRSSRLRVIGSSGSPLDSRDLDFTASALVSLPAAPGATHLFSFDEATHELIVMRGVLEATGPERLPVSRYGIGDPLGLTADPANRSLVVLDGATRELVRIELGPSHRSDAATALSNASTSRVDLGTLGGADPAAIAFNPETGHVYVWTRRDSRLHELDSAGVAQSSYDLSSIGIHEVGALLFAPSGDTTDDPERMHLYATSGGDDPSASGSSTSASVVEVALGDVPGTGLQGVLAATTLDASLVHVIEASQFTPECPDSAGLAYRPSTNSLLISDSQVNEMGIFQNVNVWETTQAGTVLETSVTTAFSNEPTGIAVDPISGHLFFSDDTGTRSIYEVDLGGDDLLGTGDDVVTSFPTSDFGSQDPEGVAFAAGLHHLFVADGVNNEIYEIDPGANGVFDGAPPSGDDVVLQFDTLSLGLPDPEGVEYNPDDDTLLIVGDADVVLETMRDGTVVREIGIAEANADNAAGITYAPGSLNPGVMNLYIADRGVDNNSDPNENDGRVYEMTLAPDPGLIQVRVAAGLDDAEETATGTMRLTSSDLELTFDGSYQSVGMRFSDLAIPQGASISEAYVQFTTDEILSVPTALLIQGQAIDDAPGFSSTAHDISSRDRTTASVIWDPVAPWLDVGEAGPDQQTPDLTGIIQEIVDREGWSSGNGLVIVVTGIGERAADSFEGDPTRAALLSVRFDTTPTECNDGFDNDGDGLSDFFDLDGDGISDPPGDPGCSSPSAPKEDPQCDDNVDNDGDGLVDWDGDPEGLGDGPAGVDIQCTGKPASDREARKCGLGFELALLLPSIVWLRSRVGRRRRRA